MGEEEAAVHYHSWAVVGEEEDPHRPQVGEGVVEEEEEGPSRR